MEGLPSADPAPLESSALREAIRYYSELEIATNAFAAPDPSGANIRRGMFDLPGITNWSVWSARQAVRLVRS